jgi:hypothetical protein
VFRLIPGEEEMEKFVRPERFDTDPTDSDAERRWFKLEAYIFRLFR